MVDPTVPHLHNELGVPSIRIGVKEFKCLGARPPHDHPHVFLDMGEWDEIVCPYCSTLFAYDAGLSPAESDPPGCVADAGDFAPNGPATAHARHSAA